MALDVKFDRNSLIINGKREFIASGAFHYFRLPVRELWRDRLDKMRQAGLNAVDIYFSWHYHSPEEGKYDFEGIRDIDYLMKQAHQAGLYVIARPGPYICSEVDAGGFPGWLLAKKDVILRCRENVKFAYDKDYMKYVREWYEAILPIIARQENLILFQIENEYNFIPIGEGLIGFLGDVFRRYNPTLLLDIVGNPIFMKMTANYLENLEKKKKEEEGHNQYMQELYQMAREFGVKVPIFHNDVIGERQLDADIVAIDNYPIMSFRFNWRGNKYLFSSMDMMEHSLNRTGKNCPLYIAEMQGGWYDFWGGKGYDFVRERLGTESIDLTVKTALSQGATLFNFFMFVGGTNWGYMGSPDVYTSIDYGSPVAESGNITQRHQAVREVMNFIEKYRHDLVKSERDESITSTGGGIYCLARKSQNKKFVFLRNMSKRGKRTRLNIYDKEISLQPLEMRVLVFDENNHLLEENGRPEISKIEKGKFPALPSLENWSFSLVNDLLQPGYDDSQWLEISSPEKMDIDDCGVHYGYIWYRGKFKGKISGLRIDARHCYTIYLNSERIASYDNFVNIVGVGKDFAQMKIYAIPPKICRDGENVLVILVESLGHHKDYEDDARNPRGIVSIDTGDFAVRWKARCGLVDGEKGMCPIVNFKDLGLKDKSEIFLPHQWTDEMEGIGIYQAKFNLNLEKDFPENSLGLVIEKAQSKANIYLNGYLLGRYWEEKGPQKKFYLPWGILKAQGENEMVIAVWKRKEQGGLGKVFLEWYA